MSLKKPIMTKSVLKDHDIGNYTYGEPKVIGRGILEIGKFCSIASDVTILLNVEHNHQWGTTYPFPALFAEAQHIPGHPAGKGPVRIGHDVHIGYGATILSGVTIGNGAVIGAKAVVASNVVPYSIVAGNPAKHIKFRFTEDWVDFMNRKLKWWDWPIDTIIKYAEAILQPPDKHLFEVKRQVLKEVQCGE